MKILGIFSCIVLMLVLVSPVAVAQQENQTVFTKSLWVGAHYTGFEDYGKLIGEYRIVDDEALPEFKFNLSARKNDGYLTFDGHYFDQNNVLARLSGKKGDRFGLDAQYVSLIHQDGQDMLANLEAREWLGTTFGGKMSTHELTDLGADYSVDRHEIRTGMKVLLSRKARVLFSVKHRTILEKGNEQKLAIGHCFSCHVESQEYAVDKKTHQVEAGLEAQAGGFDVGYFFGYRKFESSIDDPEGTWDRAVHPAKEAKADEFASRLIYQDSVMHYGVYPNTEKISHTGRLSGKLWKGRLGGSFGYSHVENGRTTVSADAYTGALSYALPVSKRSRLIGKVNALRLMADDVLIDLPDWRKDTKPVDFDYARYSSVSRIEGKSTLELITRMNPKTTLSVLGGFKRIDRVEYPTPEETYTTDKYIGQAKVSYRQSLKLRGSLKYRYERTENPLRSDRGLLEASGREVFGRGTTFYYEREDLRYLNVTSLPTDYHEIDVKATLRPRDNLNVSLGLKTTFDKNGDLDTLDVQHKSLQPNFNWVLTPKEGVMLAGGYTFKYATSRSPIAIPLFDG